MFYVFDHLIIMTDWQSALVELLGNSQLLKIQQPQRLILRSNKNYRRQNCLQTRFLPAIRNLKLFEWSLTQLNSSMRLWLKHVLHAILFLNLYISIFCSCKDSIQNSSKIQDKSSAASCCWKREKLGFSELVTTPCTNCKSLDVSNGDLEDHNNDTIPTKEDATWDSELHSCSMVLRYWREAFI